VVHAHPKYELCRSQSVRTVNKLMIGSNTSGAPKHMTRSNTFYVNIHQTGAVGTNGLTPTGTRSCSVYLESVTRSVPNHLYRKLQLTDVVNYSEEC
jgi:hypothetical protein